MKTILMMVPVMIGTQWGVLAADRAAGGFVQVQEGRLAAGEAAGVESTGGGVEAAAGVSSVRLKEQHRTEVRPDGGGYGGSEFGAGGASGFGGGGFGGGDAALGFLDTSQALEYARAGSEGRSLVIHSREPDPSVDREIEEDLNVMARILGKSLGLGGKERAMGIMKRFSSSGGPESMYIEGYGAVFRFSVNIPLLPEEEGGSADSSPAPESSEWEKTRQELYGREGKRGYSPYRAPRLKVRTELEYDSEAVKRLKSGVLEALENAIHIRHLGSNEVVTVMIANTGPSLDVTVGANQSTGWSGAETIRRLLIKPRRESTLTIRVARANLELLAQSKLSPGEFRERAVVFTY